MPDLSKLIQKGTGISTSECPGTGFGEDYVYSSGKSEFHALETDCAADG
jgi:hypothetical protein